MRLISMPRLAGLIIACTIGSTLHAQLNVNFDMTPEEMAQQLVGEGVEILNVQVTAADSSYAFYTSSGTEIGDSEGILLTTGNANNAIGPNDETGLPEIDDEGNCVTCHLYDNNFAGSPLLTVANGGLTTWDATTFEFDIVPQGDSLRFDFVFASEEYLEWVGSSFNDVFGFFISGPGVGTDVNIALIPGTSTAVAINSVNHIDNSEYFYDNQDPLGQGIQYDGLTQGLTAEVGGLTACDVYHLKLIIADGSDRIYDSGVFISKIVSNPITVLTATAGGIDYMIEGCNDGTVTFESSFVPTDPLEVVFTIDGDAEMGPDYTTDPDLGPFYDPTDSTYTLTINPGDTTVSFDINTIFDGLDEGTEYVTITLLEQLCDTLLFDSSVDFAITDSLEVTVHPDAGEICPGNCVPLSGTALEDGDATWFWDPEEGLDDPNTLNPLACPLVTTTYVLTSQISECIAQDSAVITVSELMVEFATTPVTCEDGFFGEIDLTVLNGTPSYMFSWTGPNGFTAATEDIVGLEAGEYCVTVTDFAGCVTTECITLIEQDILELTGFELSDYLCANVSCNGVCDGSIDISVAGGTGDYTFTWTGPGAFFSSQEDITDLCAGTYTVTVTDENDCMVTDDFTITEPDALDVQLDGIVDVLCNGEQTGSACVTSTGGCPPYFYNWSHDPTLTAPCAIDLASGNYTVSVSDVNGCTSDDSVDVVVGAPDAPITITVDNVSSYPGGYGVSCPDASDGSIDVTVTGGTPGYITSWLHVESGNTYFTEDLSAIPCGTYILTVTDDNDCVETETVDISCVPPITIDFTTVPNPCGDPTAGMGEITITATGGGNGGPYVHTWISGPSCPCAGLSLTGLDSGDYILEVTDAQGCVQSFTINVGENQDFTITPTVVNANCFNICDGSIDLLIVPELGTETYAWTGPDGFTADTQDISGLCPGTYVVDVTQGTCSQQFMYDITAPPDIVLDIIDATPPSCFGQNDGSIEIAVSGGTGALDVDWLPNPACFFPGSSDLVLSNLIDCDYIVVITDDDGCQLTDTISLVAPQVMNLFVETTQFDGGFNVSCAGAQDGQISVSVNGGTTGCGLHDPYEYLFDWSNCDDVALYGNDPNSPIITDLPGGVFCVNVTDCNGCLATTTINFLEPDSIDTSPEVSDYNGFNISCNGEMDGWISPNVSGGSGTFTEYEWISGDIGANDPLADTLFNLGPGEYCLYILDTNGCTDTSCFNLIEPDTISISVDNVIQVSCYGYSDGQISVSATGGSGGYTYDWVDQDLNIYVGNILTNLPVGTYTLTVTDSNGCTNTIEVVLDELPVFEVSLFAPVQGDSTEFILQCNGDSTASIIATIEGGLPDFSYLWEDCDDNFISNDNTISSLTAGCYCLTVTDAEGCEAESCIDITEPEFPLEVIPDVSLYPGDYNISCAGAGDGWIDLTTTGGVPDYTYIWHQNGDTTIISVADSLIDLGPGLYDVLVTDSNGCDTTLFLELVEPPPIISNSVTSQFDGGFNISCAGACDGTIEIDPQGGEPGYTINWGPPIDSDSTFVDGLCPDTYTVSITDSIGCEIVELITLTEPDTLMFTSDLVAIECNGDADAEICVTPTGGSGTYTYTWTPDMGDVSCISDLDPGNYCVNVSDTNGCEAEECWDVVQPDALDMTDETIAANCGVCDGTSDITVTGGVEPYVYDWGGGVPVPDDEDQTDLCAGTYTVTIIDDNLCELVQDVVVDGPDPIAATADIDHPACYGDCDGIVSLNIENAVAPYTVTWTINGVEIGTGEMLVDICNGVFDVNITDADGCTEDFQYEVLEPDSITINGTSPLWNNGFNVSEFDGSDGSIDTDVTGGTGDYTYEWGGPANIDDGTTNPFDLPAGEYMLTITDENGCVKDTVIVLTQPDDLELTTGVSPNGDGLNDFYVIYGVAEHPDNTFKVFNRWGNLVFEVTGYLDHWYGQNMNGDPLADGTYFIVFEADDRTFHSYVDLRRQ